MLNIIVQRTDHCGTLKERDALVHRQTLTKTKEQIQVCAR